MGRRSKKSNPPPAGAPLWMVTYSDMVTLLLTFFVMMLAMANFEEPGRVEAVLESIRLALGVGGFNTKLVGVSEESAHQTRDIQRAEELQPVMSQLREALARHVSDDLVKLTRTQTEIRVALDDRVLFASGSTTLHPAAYSMLSDVADVLSKYPVRVRVGGHTDATGEVERNWEISSMRAVTVVSVVQDRGGLDGRELQAIGYGQYYPADPDAEGGEAWDRRVELVIQSTSPIAYDAINQIEEVTGGRHGR